MGDIQLVTYYFQYISLNINTLYLYPGKISVIHALQKRWLICLMTNMKPTGTTKTWQNNQRKCTKIFIEYDIANDNPTTSVQTIDKQSVFLSPRIEASRMYSKTNTFL